VTLTQLAHEGVSLVSCALRRDSPKQKSVCRLRAAVEPFDA
jgi:hypothetical protein